MNKINRKYNTDYRKKIISKIDKLNDKNDFINIYNLIIEDINDITYNNNGTFININLLSDTCIEQIIKYVDDKLIKPNEEEKKINYKVYKINNDNINTAHKLSNQDKNIIKRIRS